MVDPATTDGERALWRAIIVQAIVDACSIPSPTLRWREIKEARKWLLGNDEDFIETCEMAGMSASLIRRRAERLKAQDWPVQRGPKQYSRRVA